MPPIENIRAKHQQISANRQEMSNLQFESFLEIRQVLTPAQRTEFSQLMQGRAPRISGNRQTTIISYQWRIKIEFDSDTLEKGKDGQVTHPQLII
jgi:hypothetical protein